MGNLINYFLNGLFSQQSSQQLVSKYQFYRKINGEKRLICTNCFSSEKKLSSRYFVLKFAGPHPLDISQNRDLTDLCR